MPIGPWVAADINPGLRSRRLHRRHWGPGRATPRCRELRASRPEPCAYSGPGRDPHADLAGYQLTRPDTLTGPPPE